jgi:hypothetical protein
MITTNISDVFTAILIHPTSNLAPGLTSYTYSSMKVYPLLINTFNHPWQSAWLTVRWIILNFLYWAAVDLMSWPNLMAKTFFSLFPFTNLFVSGMKFLHLIRYLKHAIPFAAQWRKFFYSTFLSTIFHGRHCRRMSFFCHSRDLVGGIQRSFILSQISGSPFSRGWQVE